MLAAILITIVIAVQIVFGLVPVPAYRPLYRGGAGPFHLVYRDDEPRYFWACIALQLLITAMLCGVGLLLR